MEKILTYIDISRDSYRRPSLIPNNLLEKSIEDYHKSKDLWSLQKSIALFGKVSFS